MKNRIVLLLMLLCQLSSAVFSQSDQKINVLVKGILMDSTNNETIPYGTIKVVDKSNPSVVIKALASDENGKFQFTANKIGEFLLTANFIGKTPANKEFVVEANKTIDLGTIDMKDNATALSEVVVSVDKPLVKVDLDKITYSMEDDPESKTNSVLEMLKKVPMITVDGEENVQLKGSSNFKIYINGKPSNMITNNPKDVLRSMPANTVKNIEVITDPGAKYDAEGVAGIINIITQKQTSMGGYTATINSRADSFGGYGAGAYMSLKSGKIGFTGNYNYYDYKRPEGTMNSLREDYIDPANSYLTQNGVSKYVGHAQYGSGELSYEIDTLNLINVNYDRYDGKNKSRMDWLIEMLDSDRNTRYEYNRFTEGKSRYGETEIGADYQRTFKKKDQLLTASYKLSFNPNDSQSDNVIERKQGVLPPNAVTNRQYSNASMDEHSFQIDFTSPFSKIHTMELGAKYIIRLNQSISGTDTLDVSDIWGHVPNVNDRFKHRQDIWASYAGYNLKLNKWGFKAGLRYEATKLKAEFPLYDNSNFNVDYSNIVPSTTVTYQLKPSQNIRFGYNMRILRPNIWQLNPFEDRSNPNFISQGNSSLDAVQSHSISSNYSFFNPKLNFNLNADYTFENNAIEQITTLIGDGVSLTTYENIGKRKRTNLSGYINWSGVKKLRLYSNLSIRYVDIVTDKEKGLSNHGFEGNVYVGGQYELPRAFRLGFNTGYYSPMVTLQGKRPGYFYHSLDASKSFMKERLTFRVYASSPFLKEWSFKTKEGIDNVFSSTSTQYFPQRQFGISVSFRFGEMKAQIKKAQRGISNDDKMSSGGGQGGNQGGGGQ